jgi:hypothetical protein
VLAWRRATTTLEHVQAVRVAMDQLARDLTNTVNFDSSGVWLPAALFGTDTLRVYSVQPSWHDGQQAHVVYVTYELGAGTDASTLTRSVQSTQEAAADLPATSRALLTGVASWRLRYGYANEATIRTPGDAIIWRDEWDHETPTLPHLIEVTVEWAEPVAGHTAIRRVVWVPQGRLGTMTGD